MAAQPGAMRRYREVLSGTTGPTQLKVWFSWLTKEWIVEHEYGIVAQYPKELDAVILAFDLCDAYGITGYTRQASRRDVTWVEVNSE